MLVAAAVVAAGVLLGARGPAPVPGPPATPAAPLAVDVARGGAAPASGRLAFAHYVPSLPVSIDDAPPERDYYARQYLTPDGEGGVHRAYGGFLRDRPLPRPPRGTDDWQLQDLRAEVEQAARAGLDGFTLDLLALGGSDGRVWRTTQLMMTAAEQSPGFRIALMPDAVALRDAPVDELARWVAELGRSPAAFRLDDGRLVVAPFHAESHDADWWRGFVDLMRTAYGTPVALVPVFLDERPHVADFAPFSAGMSNWGVRNPEDQRAPAQVRRARAVRDRGLLWVQPVSVQDVRPRSGLFQEALGTDQLRASFAAAEQTGAQWVQVVTWNDYAESTQVAPSVRDGSAFLDLLAYELASWRAGHEVRPQRDVVQLAHRVQPVATLPDPPPAKPMRPTGGTRPRDVVEALSLLTAPGQVHVRVGDRTTTCDAPAGLSTCTAPLAPGTVSATVTRGDALVTGVTSPYAVTDRPADADPLTSGPPAGGCPAPGSTRPPAARDARGGPAVDARRPGPRRGPGLGRGTRPGPRR